MSAPSPPPAPDAPAPRRSTSVVVVAVVLVLVVVLAAGSLAAWATWHSLRGDDGGPNAEPPAPSGAATTPAYPAELARYYKQALDWKRCGDNECTQLTVPLDYAEPDGETIQLAVLRAPAARRAQRVGQLVVDPGGPGGSALDFASAGPAVFGNRLTRYFDIVGMDPRGVGKSTPIECGNTEQTDEFVGVDPDPDTAAEVSEYDRVNRSFGQGCLKKSGELTRHVSTVEVAKDMDILRAALGERGLDYLGASYGTYIGAVYADLFPGNIRRMVLDGALDPTLSLERLNLEQAEGFEVALDAYLKYCIDQGNCALGNDVDEAKRKLRQFLDELDAEPLPTSSGRPLTEAQGRYGVMYPLYAKQLWPYLSIALTQATRDKAGDQLLFLADQYTARETDGYKSNQMTAFTAVTCLDYADRIPVGEIPSKFAEFDKASPTFGRLVVYDMAKCDPWPAHGTTPPRPLHAEGAPPIVVIGTTRDPATPYAWAKALASQLESGHLISRDGDGHTGFQENNECVDDAVEDYLIGGKVPKENLSC